MHATVSQPASLTKLVNCFACHSTFGLPVGKLEILPMCPACQRSHAEAEARRLLADYVALRDGTGIFSLLTNAERREQLAQFQSDDDGPRPAGGALPVEVEFLGDETLVALAAACADEIANRMHSVDEPSPRERQRIEVEAQDDPHPDLVEFRGRAA